MWLLLYLNYSDCNDANLVTVEVKVLDETVCKDGGVKQGNICGK